MERKIIKQPYVLDKVKHQLRVYDDDENEYIEDLCDSAVAFIEDWINGNIATYKNTTTLSSVEANVLIPLYRFDTLISVQINSIDVPSTDYSIVDVEGDYFIIFTEDKSNVVITYQESVVNMRYAQQCVNLLVSDWYEYREGASLEVSARNTNVSITASSSLRRMLSMYTNNCK